MGVISEVLSNASRGTIRTGQNGADDTPRLVTNEVLNDLTRGVFIKCICGRIWVGDENVTPENGYVLEKDESHLFPVRESGLYVVGFEWYDESVPSPHLSYSANKLAWYAL